MNTRQCILTVIAAFACSAPLAAQDASSPVGTILVAHGSGPEWNARVEKIADLANTGGPVEVSYLMGQAAATHRFQDVAERLEQAGVREIVVVPLMVSSHSGHADQIRYLSGGLDTLSGYMMQHLQRAGIQRADVDVPIRMARAIDDSPDAARVLAERALALADAPAEQALFLMGHGPNSAENYAAWMENLRPVADTVKAVTGFQDVKVGLVRDDAPDAVRAEAVRRIREIIRLQHALTGREVVVVPVLISTGHITNEKFPADLEGLPVRYTGDALLPHPGLARWIEARVREASRVAQVRVGENGREQPGT